MPSQLATVDIDSVIDRIARGEYQSHIAHELGIAPQNLHTVVSKHPAYRDAMRLRNMAKLDDSQNNIDTAPNGYDLARAREAFKAASWRASVENPETWGREPLVNINANGPMSVQIVSFAPEQGRLIEGDPV